MSLSWISRWLRPPRGRLDIAIGRHAVSAVWTGGASGVSGAQPLAGAGDAVVALPAPVSLFCGDVPPGTVDVLALALKAVAPRALGRYLPVHVTLPDGAVHCKVLAFDAWPNKRAARDELVRWRMGSQLGAGAALACAWQMLERGPGGYRVLALGMDEAWLRCVTDAAQQAGMVPWSVSAKLCQQFNRHHDGLDTGGGQGGVLVALDDECWSLLVFDARRRVCHAQARWRSGPAQAEPAEYSEYSDIAADIERSIMALLQHQRELSIGDVYLVAQQDADAMARALDARLHRACVRLPGYEGRPAAAHSAGVAQPVPVVLALAA